MFSDFSLPFVQHGVIQVLFLAVAGGLLGTWIVLRGLAFYSHAVAAASFPGLPPAGGARVAPPPGALAGRGVLGSPLRSGRSRSGVRSPRRSDSSRRATGERATTQRPRSRW